jgi:predicted ester cyclase
LGIPPTGKEIKISGCMIYHWQGDKIIEQWDYTDMMGLLQQVGVIPAMG